ncbi:helix-turn-helix domain-containing protein [Spirillospora sp. CA-294931]|uniref:helix-turn-helix domain-containing protein n=1 Tax=Spirillospora sp. CA-294931 TaxID=3240042 RepID=UPI003D8DC114
MYDPRQRLVALTLLNNGLTAAEVHRRTGISRNTLGKWRKDLPRAMAQTLPSCPRCHDRSLDSAVYAYLFGLYLGDGHIADAPGDKGVFRLEIACGDMWPGLIEDAASAISNVMPGLKVGRLRSTGCTNVGAYSKHWPCLFPQHGPGMKHTRKIELVRWQREIVDRCREDFVRGLIHSDGCRTVNRIRRHKADGEVIYEYPRYFFTNASDDIRDLFTEALDRLGIAWKQNNPRHISVARREAVARLDEFVGPKH